MRVAEADLDYEGALPLPKEWRVMGDDGDKSGGEEEKLARDLLEEWLSAHPMDGG